MSAMLLLAAAVQCWPLPNEVRKSTDYTVTVDGRPLDVARTKDNHPLFIRDYQWETEGRMKFASFSYAQFEAEGEVSVEVKWRGGGTNFTAHVPFYRAFRPFGRDNALMLAGNAIDRNPPDPKAPGVKYFGPGYHRQEMIAVRNVTCLPGPHKFRAFVGEWDEPSHRGRVVRRHGGGRHARSRQGFLQLPLRGKKT